MNFESCNNVYEPGAGWKLKGTSYSNLEFIQQIGFDSCSVHDEPLFENREMEIFKPIKSSVTYNAGIDIGITHDFDGNEITEIPEIGPYEFIEDDTIIQNTSPVINNQNFIVYDSVSEGTIIGTILANDIDTLQSLSYQLISGNSNDVFLLSSATGDLIVNNKSELFNNDFYQLLIRVTDDFSNPLSDSGLVIINVYHVDTTPAIVNHPPVIYDQDFDIREDDDLDNLEIKVISYDPDTGQNLTYSIISGNVDNTFSLNSSSGQLTVSNASALNFQSKTEIGLNIKVQDNGEGNLTDTAFITITLIPELTVFYIDPDNTDDPRENGSSDHPFDSWKDVAWKDGNSYLQKRNTTANENKINIYANNVILGAYGEGERPTINSMANDFAIRAFDKSGVTIQNLKIIAGEAISCVYFLGSSSENNLIEHCRFEGANNGVRIIDGKTITLRYNIFSNNSDAIYSFAEITKIYYNIFKENEVGINVSSYLSSTEIFNNVFYDNRRGVSTSYSSLTIFNNIFYLMAKGDQAINHQLDKLVSDNNIYYPEQEGFLDIGNMQYSSLHDYQITTGLDLNSFTSDPLFTDIYNENFAVEPESQAIDGGRNVGILIDFFGFSVPAGNQPDIGFIESRYEKITTLINPFEYNKETPGIFPNPSDGRFKIFYNNQNFEKSRVQIRDVAGTVLHSCIFYSYESEFVQSLNLPDLSSGIYVIFIEVEDKIYSQKIIINRDNYWRF
jgi:hypothetical protein